ncbi:apolipoprotein N-acyltransferase [Thiosulfativibrio zosterae]|uniref:Apolipoprotein N-acyltransferase n=1 Tax=Thiosulfativibrio zosterae TaxID=2675053 RepID=A0A6F8PPY1_9GAMM|nr:apolipoprotein N-acyltransferase [Thiosulfativibrio zosterae]BBP44094.1 apolipoprotein N-acyltransferase [Thiosulfativibrio zosterae]
MKNFFRYVLAVFKPEKKVLITFLLGALSVTAFAPFHFAPAAVASLVGLFWFWSQATSRLEGFKLGLWFGLGQFGFGVSWLISSIYLYAEVPLVLAVLATFIFILFLSLYVGFAGWVAAYFSKSERPYFNALLVFPLAWVSFEWLRGSLFGGFPFLLMGNSHLDTWLDGYAPIFGVLGVSWAIALTASALLLIVTQKAWVGASSLLALVWLSASGLQKIEWVTPVGPPARVALVQGNIPQEQKWQAKALLPSLKTYVGLTKQHMDADIIVWPETAVASYFDVVEKGALHSFIKDAKLLETDILMGVITRNADKTQYYNAIVNAHNPEQVYQKSHLVPFSEFFPFSSVLSALSKLFNVPFSEFTPGDAMQKPMQLGAFKVGLSVCYEMSFGEELAEQLQDAQFLVTVSNDAWFAHTFEPAQQLQEVQMRALELGREIARSTNTGFTAIVDVKGRIKQEIPAYKTGVLKGEVQPYEGTTPFVYWQQMPLLFLFCVLYGFLLAPRFILKRPS